jgi:hypothetical protein
MCLVFLDADPEHYPRGQTPRAGAEALIELNSRLDIRRANGVLSPWLKRRGLPE